MNVSSPVVRQSNTSATLEKIAREKAALERYNDAWAAFRADQSLPAMQAANEALKEYEAVLCGVS
jgi:hypothetical protein